MEFSRAAKSDPGDTNKQKEIASVYIDSKTDARKLLSVS